MKKQLLLFSFLLFVLLIASPLFASSLAEQVSGKILLDVENNGEAWYVYPETLERYYLQDGDAAYEALRTYGLGITDADIRKIPIGIEERFEMTDSDGDGLVDLVEDSIGSRSDVYDTDGDGYSDGEEILAHYSPITDKKYQHDTSLVEEMKGMILLQVEAHGEAWYVNPADGRRYYLGNGEASYQIMRYLSLGITSSDLSQISISSNSPEPPFTESYTAQYLETAEGTFYVRMIRLHRDIYEMVTDTADSEDCEGGCSALPLSSYIEEHGAVAGIHGTYFCPPDYADCASVINSYYPPVYNTGLDKMINDDSIIYHNRPMIVETTSGQLELFYRPDDFGDTLADFESSRGLTVSAAIGNWPSLIEFDLNIVADEPMEPAFSVLGTRGGIGWDDQYYYLVIASSATVQNLAAIFETLEVHEAMNLDGGGTAALYYEGAYKVGPGRELPNAIVFKEIGYE
jgi:hypothetical protein